MKPGGDADNGEKVYIKGGLWVDGSINFTGEIIQTNTEVQITAQLDISNSGTGPAIIARQYGSQPIAEFHEESGIAMVIKDLGHVAMSKMLDVSGATTLGSTLNVTGDATVSMIIAKLEGKLHTPKPKDWNDHLNEV